MKWMLAVLLTVFSPCTGHSAVRSDDQVVAVELDPSSSKPAAQIFSRARPETTWIFDADFENLTADNYGLEDLGEEGDSLTGWYTADHSGEPPHKNHWHLDTLHAYGDSSMWCGMRPDFCACIWEQPRGYGNNWEMYLTLDFDLTPYDSARISFKQIFAMEKGYDYGYLDVCRYQGDWCECVYSVTNPGFAGQPGQREFDWNGDSNHPSIDLTDYVGWEVELRWRFESSQSLSSIDFVDNPPFHSVTDGAWYIDEVEIFGDGERVYYENFEDGADSLWDYADFPGEDQVGVTWRRVYNPSTGRGFNCGSQEGWMLVPTHPGYNTMVDREIAFLASPVIDISNADHLVYSMDYWFDCPDASNDFWTMYVACGDDSQCVHPWQNHFGGSFYYGGPYWKSNDTYSFGRYVGNDYLRFGHEIGWLFPSVMVDFHMGGMYLNRVRLGSTTQPSDPMSITVQKKHRLDDTFHTLHAGRDSVRVTVEDADGIAVVNLIYSIDFGETWQYMQMLHRPGTKRWVAIPSFSTKGAESRYYIEATDSLGYTKTEPENAPYDYYEFAILPMSRGPGRVLVVASDHEYITLRKGMTRLPRDYYREAMSAWGFQEYVDYDVFDIGWRESSHPGNGPDSLLLYETVAWFTGDMYKYCVTNRDQENLAEFLDSGGNLLLSGNEAAHYIRSAEPESIDFFEEYLRSSLYWTTFIDPLFFELADTLLTVVNAPGSFAFIDDGEALLLGGCPDLQHFDAIDTLNGSLQSFEYISNETGNPHHPGGVQYSGDYRLVFMPFGLEYVADIEDRVSILGNVFEFFGRDMPDSATDVRPSTDQTTCGAKLLGSYPNPFNPTVTISYSIAEPGPVKLQVFNINGQLVRTLVDGHVQQGRHKVIWDGTDRQDREVSGGIYFYRLTGPAVTETKRMIAVR